MNPSNLNKDFLTILPSGCGISSTVLFVCENTAVQYACGKQYCSIHMNAGLPHGRCTYRYAPSLLAYSIRQSHSSWANWCNSSVSLGHWRSFCTNSCGSISSALITFSQNFNASLICTSLSGCAVKFTNILLPFIF